MNYDRFIELYAMYHRNKVTPEQVEGELLEASKEDLVNTLMQLIIDLELTF